MIDKLAIIKRILETDEETDKKILSMLESEEEVDRPKGKVIHIEERVDHRKPVLLEADINTGNERIRARAEDVSLCGAFIRTDKKIPKGEEIAIRLISSDGEEFAFISEVVRVKSEGIGVLIKTISNVHQDRFRKFVHRL